MTKAVALPIVGAVVLVAAAPAEAIGTSCSARAGVEELHTFRGYHGERVRCSTARRVVYRWYDHAYAGRRGCGFKGRTAQCAFRVNERRWGCVSGGYGDGSWRLDCWGPQHRSLVAVVWP